ncbi:prenylated Rab acceptor protein 1-like isoform X2 [Oratosquilla oratoria]|uniref:prenylated Rab acceptor protein 1-like isoform X2 n=1 Tax=Oratosquilla oratoria TaxID=337810 RepID=UPI003F7780B9
MASPAAMEWLHKRRDTVQPWTLFVNTSKFKIGGLIEKIVESRTHYQLTASLLNPPLYS